MLNLLLYSDLKVCGNTELRKFVTVTSTLHKMSLAEKASPGEYEEDARPSGETFTANAE